MEVAKTLLSDRVLQSFRLATTKLLTNQNKSKRKKLIQFTLYYFQRSRYDAEYRKHQQLYLPIDNIQDLNEFIVFKEAKILAE